jgi:hypothetical protein
MIKNGMTHETLSESLPWTQAIKSAECDNGLIMTDYKNELEMNTANMVNLGKAGAGHTFIIGKEKY